MCPFSQKKHNRRRPQPACPARNHHRLPGQRSLRKIVAELSVRFGALRVPILRTHFPPRFIGVFHASIHMNCGKYRQKRQNPQASGPFFAPGVLEGSTSNLCAGPNYFKTASLNAFAARKRTTVLALILMASPVAGLRPMRALRCAFTARPIPGITNFPADFASFTARLNSSSKKATVCFLEIGFSGVLTLSVIYAIILDLLSGFAIELRFPPQIKMLCGPGVRDAFGTIATEPDERKGNLQKSPIKRAFPSCSHFGLKIYCAASCS